MELFWKDFVWFSRSYNITNEIKLLLEQQNPCNTIVFIDSNVKNAYPELNLLSSKEVVLFNVCCGECVKNLSTIERLIKKSQNLVNKNTLIVAIGGGTLLDIVGFYSGVLFRGLQYISIPTTSISMADSAFGGKTAVNLFSKNQIGLYHFPKSIYINPIFLNTLPKKYYISGLMETIKLSFFIDEIASLWEKNKKNILDCSTNDAIDLIMKSARVKLELFEKDPFEEYQAAIFLYGHTFANVFETYSWEKLNKYLPHGFAVGLGILFCAWLTEKELKIEKFYHSHLHKIQYLINIRSLISNFCPEKGADFGNILRRDKYTVGNKVSIPAFEIEAGFYIMDIKAIIKSYKEWRKHELLYQIQL